MRNLILFLLMMYCFSVKANDSIDVKINQLSFAAKDSIHFSCRIHDYAKLGLAAVTLNVWIQDIEKRHTWKFRYPVLNGELDASLAIGDSVPPGKYAVNFILQKGLYKIEGVLKDPSETSLNYFMHLKNGQKLINTINVAATGNFVIKNILFEKEAVIVFRPSRKMKQSTLDILVATPLDSAFTPIAVFSQFIDVKVPPQHLTTHTYDFDFEKTYANTTLPEVVVTSVKKKKVEEFNEKFSLGLFQGENKMFDGLENDEISNTPDIETFLQKHVPGLVFTKEGGSLGTGTYISWRNEPVVIYIDEMPLDAGESIYVSPSDVAMIKVYNPPASVNIAGRTAGDPTSKVFSGAIAIYTKRANFGLHDKKGRHSFHLKGYTPQVSTWQ